jgi:phosphohistidine phosphatase
MFLYLIRHAEAVPRDPGGSVSDTARPLTPGGHDQARRLGEAFRRLGVPLSHLLTSPLVRSRETAEDFLVAVGRPGLAVTECAELAPGRPSKKLARFLRGLEGEHVAAVGHEPDLGVHAAWLIGSRRAQMEFAKGGAACIHCDGPPRKRTGTLLWLVTPAWVG